MQPSMQAMPAVHLHVHVVFPLLLESGYGMNAPDPSRLDAWWLDDGVIQSKGSSCKPLLSHLDLEQVGCST